MLSTECLLQQIISMLQFTEIMYLQEEMKTAPFGDVWNEYLERENVTKNYFEEVEKYEQEVLVKRK